MPVLFFIILIPEHDKYMFIFLKFSKASIMYLNPKEFSRELWIQRHEMYTFKPDLLKINSWATKMPSSDPHNVSTQPEYKELS